MSATIEADVMVVGAGPAGLAAAARAAEAGRRVVLVDAAPAPGGQIWRHRTGALAPADARPWIGRCERAGVRTLAGAEVVDALPGHSLTVVMRGEATLVRAPAFVLATGARELFLPFPGWTLPGVLGAGGLQALVKGGLAVRGKRVVLAGSGPLLLPVAASLSREGARLVIVAEQTPPAALRTFTGSLWRSPSRIVMAAALRAAFAATPYRAGVWVTRADGDAHLREVTLTDGARTWREPCELLACGYGLIPSTELALLLGCGVARGAITVDARQATTVPTVFAAGECTGIGGAPLSVVEGEIAGLAAAGGREIPRELLARRESERAFAARVAEAFALRAELRALAAPDTILCRCEDVMGGAVANAHDAREAKLHSRAGMGACQGRICGAALQHLRGWDPPAPRPPLFPAPVSALAAGDAHGS